MAAAGALPPELLVVLRWREWVLRMDVRWLISFHLVRCVGIYFIYLHREHELRYEFAVLGEIGDIIVAALAILVLSLLASKPLLIGGNILALVDILRVAATATYPELAVPGVDAPVRSISPYFATHISWANDYCHSWRHAGAPNSS